MNNQVSIQRSRGAVSGAALILLGLWGGLAPFVGPYLHFGFNPDKAWAYTSGRLYFSAIPGAAALVGGLVVCISRSRLVGVLGGVLAALGGAWFLTGSGVTLYLLKQTSITTGAPLGTAGTARAYLEILALYGAVGALIVFFGALACGRLSMISARDAAAAETATGSLYYPEYAATGAAAPPDAGGYSGTTGQFPAVPAYGTTADQFPAAAGDYPTATADYPGAPGQYPGPGSQYSQPTAFPPSAAPFPDAPRPFSGPPTQS
jgi:hypothetical protein